MEPLEARQLLSANPVYVAHLSTDSGVTSSNANYWIDTTHPGAFLNGDIVHSYDNSVTGAVYGTNAFNTVSGRLPLCRQALPDRPRLSTSWPAPTPPVT